MSALVRGYLFFCPYRTLADIDKTWLPRNSTYLSNKEWRAENFDENVREHSALLVHDDDVLTREAMLKVQQRSQVALLLSLKHFMVSVAAIT